MRHHYHTLDVFTRQVFGGNPLAVFADGRGLSDGQMQRAARELNLSETVFVLPPETPEGTRRLRIFTPAVELPFAGHPTVGTAVLLAMLGEVSAEGGECRIVFEEGVGPVPVLVRSDDDGGWFAQLSAARRPEHGPPLPDAAELAALLGVDEEDVLTAGLAPAAFSAGVPFAFVPLRDRNALARARLDPARWERTMKDAWAPHVYPFTPDADAPASFRVRMFAPAMGIAEDPATGGAAAAFAGYLAAREGADGAFAWIVEQGIEMGRPSRLYLEAGRAGGETVSVRVGGSAVLVGEGWMEIPGE
jgi:trans-2,3-dihydro-3-hydroxyanthranilate isomerase